MQQRRAVARHDAVLDHQREPLRAQPDAEAHVLDESERLDQVAVAVREVGEARVSYEEGSSFREGTGRLQRGARLDSPTGKVWRRFREGSVRLQRGGRLESPNPTQSRSESRHALMTQRSLVVTTAMLETPYSPRVFADWISPGRWRSEHVGVKAPTCGQAGK